MNIWRFDKKEPLRFPLKESLSVFKTDPKSHWCAGGDRKGLLSVWQMPSGELVSDIESAHYMEITDLDINEEMLITGGKDCKVKVWLIADLIRNDTSK